MFLWCAGQYTKISISAGDLNTAIDGCQLSSVHAAHLGLTREPDLVFGVCAGVIVAMETTPLRNPSTGIVRAQPESRKAVQFPLAAKHATDNRVPTPQSY